MKKSAILLIAMLIGISQSAFSWGKMGHDAVAYIAECNLTKKAKKNIEKYLGGHSIVYYASWMDRYRETPQYKHTTGWHGAAVDENFYYTDAVAKPTGDVISGLEGAIKNLENYKNLDDSTVAVNLKYVIHLVGDMHCPVHVKYPKIKGYNITVNGKEYSYHSVWDTYVLELNHRWGYVEWQHQIDRCTKKEKKNLAAGTPREWFHENAVSSRMIYDMAPKNSIQGWDFLNAAHPYAESQIQKAGYRLAKVLNDIFG